MGWYLQTPPPLVLPCPPLRTHLRPPPPPLSVQVRHRLLHSAWRVSLRPDHLLRLLQCCRLLSRDNVLRQRLVEAGGVKVGAACTGGGLRGRG